MASELYYVEYKFLAQYLNNFNKINYELLIKLISSMTSLILLLTTIQKEIYIYKIKVIIILIKELTNNTCICKYIYRLYSTIHVQIFDIKNL